MHAVAASSSSAAAAADSLVPILQASASIKRTTEMAVTDTGLS